MKLQEVPVLLITGYLGSGKTTLLNHILNNEKGYRFAVVVNDIGEVNIDARLIQKGGVVGGSADSADLVALQNGCICCSLQSDLVKQVADLVSSRRFDYIVIEASGICEPAPIARTICSMRQMPGVAACGAVPVLDSIVTVVDALRLKDEFGCGDALRDSSIGEGDLQKLVIEQIEFCNIVLLNKVSEVTAAEAAEIRAVIRALQPKAEIIDCDYAKVDLDKLVGTGRFDFEDVATSATWVAELEHHHDDDDDDPHHHHHDDHEEHHGGHCGEATAEHHHHHHHDDGEPCPVCGHHHHHGHSHTEEYGIETMVYYRRPPFDLNRFDHFAATQWPANIIRAKGVCYFSNFRDMSYLFESAGSQKSITEAGQWYATAPEEELRAMMAIDPTLRRDWDDEYGDRMVKIVIIGRHLDRAAIEAALDSCLADK
ncbi:MAG: GTP-binding protein [[Clostridium] fimetarium]|nr:GTP-binding protein [Alistipes timonensis]MCM1405100.1 GTP-binding protein [[Clostridium] fimetarium]